MGVPVGTKLGRYEVVRHLARGGMADLSVARATGIENFERHVVIKHLRPEQSNDAAFVQMFVTEARLAGALHHHNIVQVHDIGQAEGRHFFAMEYVHGEDLRHLLSKLCERREYVPIQHVVSIATAVCAALHHAHEQKGSDRKPLGIVHRDVTPANIIVGYDGNVKVVDFGIAKAALRTADTAVGMLKGKVPYMAPEQCTGKAIDRRSDVFALGIVLYELVTVRRLFKGGNEFFTMTAVVHGDIPKPTTHRKDLPVALENIILKALSRKPSDRYQTADEMRIALDEFADTAGIRTSNTALADYMKKLFGDKPEPWMVDTTPSPEAPVDFDKPVDKTDTGLVVIPNESIENTSIPKSVATTRGSLIEQARLNAISSKLETTPRPPIMPARPPLKKALGLADTDLVQVADDTIPGDDNNDPAIWERAERERKRMGTDVDEKTDISTPPPPPEQRSSRIMIAATTPEREHTDVVTPLPVEEVGDHTSRTRNRPVDRKWMYAGGVAVLALTIAIVIMATGRSVDETTNRVANTEPAKPRPEPVATPEPVKVEPPKPEPGTTAYKPDVEPKPVDPEPKVVKPDEPKPDDKIEDDKINIEDEKVADPPKTTVKASIKTPPRRTTRTAPKPVVKTKPTPKTTPKTPAADPQWDPNALFLKPKK